MGAAGKTAEGKDKRTMRTSSVRKGRNNKIYTAKGPRDRRIRLSADIAIQFYDVQDRLGYDRATEAVDWLISKAKGPIEKLFDSSFQQETKQVTHIGAQSIVYKGNYLAESMSGGEEDLGVQGDFLSETMSRREINGAANFHNSCNMMSGYNCTVDSSMFLPCIQMEDSSEGQCFAHSIFSRPLALEYCSMPSFQQIPEKGQNPRTITFNSKSNSENEEHPFISYSVPLFLHPPNCDTSSSLQRYDPEPNLCPPGNCTATFSDSDQRTIY